MPEADMDAIITRVHDANLRLVLSFGIGMHHAGLRESDRKIVEELFTNLKIQVLVATSTLAWGVNMPAHLVVVKGTEFFDGKQKRCVFCRIDVMIRSGVHISAHVCVQGLYGDVAFAHLAPNRSLIT